MFQNWAIGKVTSFLSKELQTKVHVDRIDIQFIKSLELQGLYIEDRNKDTLVHIKSFSFDLNSFSYENKKLALSTIQLKNGVFYLRKYDKSKKNNLQFLIDYFAGKPDSLRPKQKPFDITINSVNLEQISFKYMDESNTKSKKGINIKDLDISNLNVKLTDFDFSKDRFTTSVKNISFKEKSGFILSSFKSNLLITSKEFEISNLNLRTPQSTITKYIKFSFPSWAAFNHFNTEVEFKTELEKSLISATDLNYFAPGFQNIALSIRANGIISGHVNNLKAKNLEIKAGNNTLLSGNYSINGLPNIKETFLDLRFKEFKTNKFDLDRILSGLNAESRPKILPKEIQTLGKIVFTGNFTGFLNDFVTSGKLSTNIGTLISDLNVKFDEKNIPSYSGNLKAINFDLGKIAENEPLLGKISFNAKLNGKGIKVNSLKEELFAVIDYIDLNGYRYSKIIVNGELDKKLFKGNFDLKDKNADLNFDGTIDFNNEKPIFSFKSDVRKLNLKSLNLYKDSLSVSTKMEMNFSGKTINDLQGTMRLAETNLTYLNQTFDVGNILLNSSFVGNSKRIVLQSDIADAELQGQIEFNTLIPSFKNILIKYLPSYNWNMKDNIEPQVFNFNLNIKNIEPVTSIFLPALKIKYEGNLQGNYNSISSSMDISGFFKELSYNKTKLQNVIVDGETTDNAFAFNIASDKVEVNKSLVFNEVIASNYFQNDSLRFNIKLSNNNRLNLLDLNGNANFKSDSIFFKVLPSEVTLNNQVWNLKPQSTIVFRNNAFTVNGFGLTNLSQKIFFDGQLSETENDVAVLLVKNLDIGTIKQFYPLFKPNVSGIVNSTVNIYSALKTPRVSALANITDFSYNSTLIGNISANTGYNPVSKTLFFDGSVENNLIETVSIAGNIYPERTDNNLDIKVLFKETDLLLVEPFIRKLVSNVKGKASAEITIKGSFNDPDLGGYIDLMDAGVTVIYLKTPYKFSKTIYFKNDIINIENLIMSDPTGNNAIANGTIKLTNLTKPIFDISIQAKNFLCLNTTSRDNKLYYGKAYATGLFKFKGPVADMKIDISASTNRGTQFFIPLSDQNTVGQQSFINFVKPDTLTISETKKLNLAGLTMNFNLDITEDAELQLIFDEVSGDIIKGRGNGDLRMVINSLGDFDMYGLYTITEGDYLFTLQNLINKRFKVDRGGTIRWDGSPYEATVNIDAIYNLRAQIKDLYLSNNPTDTVNSPDRLQRIPVSCRLEMRNSLFNPDISFNLEFPDNRKYESEFAGYLSSADNVNKEVFSLLVFNRFAGGNLLSASSGTQAVNELLSNQFSNWASQLFYEGLDVNISSTAGVGGSLRLFNDRVTINGNVINSDNSTTQNPNQQSNFSGDFSVEGKLNNQGNIQAKAFNRPPSIGVSGSSQNNQNVQGVGLNYREDFDSFKELWIKLFKKRKQ